MLRLIEKKYIQSCILKLCDILRLRNLLSQLKPAPPYPQTVAFNRESKPPHTTVQEGL